MEHYGDVRQIKICQAKGIPITKDSHILDFGCGEGTRVYQLIDEGFPHACGFNKGHYMGGENPIKFRCEKDRAAFRFADDGIIPWPDGTFDLIISDQVFEHVIEQEQAFREIYRVLKPGGVSVHVIPAKWQVIEPHIKVPLGGLTPFKRYTWYYLWALLGVRSPYQHAKSVRSIAAGNLTYARNHLKYLSCWAYQRLMTRVGFQWSWEDLAYLQTSYKPNIQQVGKVAATFPIVLSLIRTLRQRVLFLQK